MFQFIRKGQRNEKKEGAVQRMEPQGKDFTGIPSQLKERIEGSTGISLDDVRVHYNSDRPAKLDALAYTRGSQVEIAPGQEQHLAHELGHVVQQKLGAVRANARHASGVAMNTDPVLERQADEIGAGKRVEIVQRMGENVVQRCPPDSDDEEWLPGPPKTYSRPTHFREGVRDQVWEAAKDAKGKVHDPLTGKEMEKDEPWDMGHKPGYEFRKHQEHAMKTGMPREQFLDEHNDPDHYRPELPSSNRSHRGEDHTHNYYGK